MYAVHGLLTGDPVAAFKNVAQMALDLPTGGFLNRNMSLAQVFDDDGDITEKADRKEFSDVLSEWGVRSGPQYMSAGETAALDLLGMATDPLTYLGGTGVFKGLASGAVKAGGRAAGRRVFLSALNQNLRSRAVVATGVREVMETAVGKIERVAQSATPEVASRLTSTPIYTGMRHALDNTTTGQALTQQGLRDLMASVGRTPRETQALQRQFGALERKAAENIFFQAAADVGQQAPGIPVPLLNPDGSWAVRNWRNFADTHVDGAIAQLERQRLLENPREMAFRIPGTDIRTPGIPNFWSRVGRYGTAPGWVREVLHRTAPAWGEGADQAVVQTLDDLYAKFFNKSAKYSYLLPEGMIRSVERFRAEQVGADRVFARKLQQFGSDVVDPITGRPRGVTDPMAEIAGKHLADAQDVWYRTFQPHIRERVDGTTLDLNAVRRDIEAYRPSSPQADRAFYLAQAQRFLYPGRLRLSSSPRTRISQVINHEADVAHVAANAPLPNEPRQALDRLDYIEFPLRGELRRIYYRRGNPRLKSAEARARRMAEEHRDDLILLYENDRFLGDLSITEQVDAYNWQGPLQPNNSPVQIQLGATPLTLRERNLRLRQNPGGTIVSGPITAEEWRRAVNDDLTLTNSSPPRESMIRLDVDNRSRGAIRRPGTDTINDPRATAMLLDAHVRVTRRAGGSFRDAMRLFRATNDHVISATDVRLAMERDIARQLDPSAYSRAARRNVPLGPMDESLDRMFTGVNGREIPPERIRRLLLRKLDNHVRARTAALKEPRQSIVRGRLIDNVARSWASLPEWGTLDRAALEADVVARTQRAFGHLLSVHPNVARRVQPVPADAPAWVHTYANQRAQLLGGTPLDPPPQVYAALDGIRRTVEREHLEAYFRTPDGAHTYGRAKEFMNTVLDDFQRVPRELSGVGVWPTSMPANPFYLPHQLTPLFQDIVRRSLGHPEFARDLDRLLRGLGTPEGVRVGDVFTGPRSMPTAEEFRAHADAVLGRRLAQAPDVQRVLGDVDPRELTPRLVAEVDQALRDLAGRHHVDMTGITPFAETNLLKLWRERMMAHHRTMFRAKSTREAMNFLGIKPEGRLGRIISDPTGVRLRGQVADPIRYERNKLLNPVLRDYLQYQFEPLGARRLWVQRMLGGGSFRIRVPTEGRSFFREWGEVSEPDQINDWFRRRIINPRGEGNGQTFVEFDWPGLNYFWKPALTSIAVHTPFTDRGAIPLNPAYHVRNTLGALFMGMTDPDMAFGAQGMYANLRAVLGTMWDGYFVRLFGGNPQLEGDLADFLRYLGDDLDQAVAAEERLRNSTATIGAYSMPEVLDIIGQVLGQRIPTGTQRIAMTRTDIAVGLSNLDIYGRQIHQNGPWAKAAFNRMVNLGTEIAEYSETRLRLNGLLTLLSQGVDAQEAIRRVNHAFVDYSVNSSVEMLLRDFIPFAKWSLGASKWTKDIANRPILVNWMGRVRASGESAFLPERVEDSLAVPLPWLDSEGNQQFLLSLGLPLETTMNILGIPLSPRAFRRNVLGGLQPAIKLPAEAITGRNFFFGDEFGNFRRAPRWLPEFLTRTITLPDGTQRHEVAPEINEIINAMPMTRLNSMANAIFDDRRSAINKAVNILTGIRTMSVDQEREFKLRLADYLKDSAKRGLAGERIVYFERGFNPEDMPEDLRIILSTLRSVESAERKRRKGVLNPRI